MQTPETTAAGTSLAAQTSVAAVVMAPVSPAMAKLLHQLQAQIIKERDQAEEARPAGTIVLAPVEAGTWKTVDFGTCGGAQDLRVRSDTGEFTLYRDHPQSRGQQVAPGVLVGRRAAQRCAGAHVEHQPDAHGDGRLRHARAPRVMSRQLDQLLGKARRAECLKNDLALAHGVTHTRAIIARGNHLAAQNDEPEPTFRDIEAKANADARAIVRGLQP